MGLGGSGRLPRGIENEQGHWLWRLASDLHRWVAHCLGPGDFVNFLDRGTTTPVGRISWVGQSNTDA